MASTLFQSLLLGMTLLYAGPHTLCAASDSPAMSSQAPLRTPAHVDLARYMGDWRVIANIPYFAERGCVDSIEAYQLRPDGKIANTFTYRKKSFDQPQKQVHATGTVVNKTTNAEWRVRFFGLISTKYFILDVDPHYQWAAIAHPSRNYGWVLAREKTLPEHTYQEILHRFAEQGYDTHRFQKVPQVPGQPPQS